MALAIQAEPPPLREEPDGTVRVGGTRVLLDTVVAAFREGASPEQIAEQYPDLALADVYAAIGYCLRNRVAVDAYIAGRRQEADRLRTEIEGRIDPRGIRDRLLTRRASRG
jgi:uncharacterized protein (DUF433 family)